MRKIKLCWQYFYYKISKKYKSNQWLIRNKIVAFLEVLFKDTQPQRYLASMACHFISCIVKMDLLQFCRNWLRQDNTKRRSYCKIQFSEALNRHVKEKAYYHKGDHYRPPIILWGLFYLFSVYFIHIQKEPW